VQVGSRIAEAAVDDVHKAVVVVAMAVAMLSQVTSVT